MGVAVVCVALNGAGRGSVRLVKVGDRKAAANEILRRESLVELNIMTMEM